jgi:tetratricopeptide (TPR) repeat protein
MKKNPKRTISTKGAPYIEGNVQVNGDFVIGNKLIVALGKRAFLLGAIVLAVLIGGAAYFLYLALSPQPPTRMTGDFNIAIAGFTQQGDFQNTNTGLEVARRVYDRFNNLGKDSGIKVWPPEWVGLVTGKDRDARAISAEQIAKRINADILVYGTLINNGKSFEISPEFYVSSKDFYLVGEIVGQHELGTPILVSGQDNPAERILTSKTLSTRSEILSRLVLALSYFALQRPDDALAELRSAESNSGWADNEGKYVAYLFIGNMAGKKGDYATAERALKRALEIDPEYARALVGLANIYYLNALPPPSATGSAAELKNTNFDLLNLAIETYQKANSATNKPALSDISTKVHYGLGQCYFVRAQGGLDLSFNSAVEEFRFVIADYADGANPRVQEIAAESHARLGLIFALQGAISSAADEYEIAAKLLSNIDGALYNPQRADIFQKRARELRGQ